MEQDRDAFNPSARVRRSGVVNRRAVFALCVLGGVGAWAYPRYFGPGATCALPTPADSVPHIELGKGGMPLSVVPGWVARLDRATNPIAFKATGAAAELRGVAFEGGVFGRQVVPLHGSVAALAIAGKKYEIRNGNFVSGCIDVQGLGKMIVLFSNSLTPTATIVLTDPQLAHLR